MNSKTAYRTLQKDKILETLKQREGQHLTAMEIYELLKGRGVKVGLTTVYRHLERLMTEGQVVKSIVDENTPACFEYCNDDEHDHDHDSCYHCKCVRCGRLVHIHCDDVSRLEQHIREEHGFYVDPHRTVFFGLCEDCRRETA